MGTTPPPIYTVNHVEVKIGGIGDTMDTLLFSSCSPPDWSMEAPAHIFHGDGKMPFPVVASVQKPTYGQMTLTQGWDKNYQMAKWKALMESSKALKDKWKDVTITFYDSDGTTAFAGWHTPQAILVGYSHSGSDASSTGVLTVTVTLQSVGTWEQTDGSAQITA